MSFIVGRARALEKGIKTIDNILARVGMVFILLMMFLGAGDVIGRYVFNKPITGAMEISSLLQALVVFLAWGYITSLKAHVSVDILFRHYPPRAQAIIDFIVALVMIFIFSLIAWQNINIAVTEWQKGKLLSTILLPVAPFKLFVVVGAFLLCLECVIQMVHLVPEMSGKKES